MWGFIVFFNKIIDNWYCKVINKNWRKYLNIRELKMLGIKKLIENNIEEPTMKINILLQFIFRMSKTELLVNDYKIVEDDKIKTVFQYINELIEGMPIQYITNHQEFMGLDFYVDKNVLIPQPDTELLVEKAIYRLKKIATKSQLEDNINVNKEENINNNFKLANLQIKCDEIRVLDLCTGSGAIAVAIAYYLNKIMEGKKIIIYASDVSKDALKVAKKNAEKILCNNKNVYIEFIESNMFENIDGKFDLIISNPPYIESNIIGKLPKEVQNEPCIALDGGKDGLDFYRIIANEGKDYLRENGSILLEIGYNQKEDVTKIFKNYNNVKCFKDLNGNNRVIEVF